MCFDGAARHIELTGNLVVIAPLQQQVDDLPFPWSELDLGILHLAFPFPWRFLMPPCKPRR